MARSRIGAALARLARSGRAVAQEDARTVDLGDGMAVVLVRDDTVGEVTERYVGIRGTPSRVVRDVARERLTRQQLASGEEPWFPDVAARLGGLPD
ncbi:MAG: hypothetical protein H5T83_02675 [Actinotalea sp.]|nr:hypothetical protein [Actinotalea sp.]